MPEFLPSFNRQASGSRRLIILAVFAALSTTAFAQSEDKDVMDKMIQNPSLKTFVNLVAKAGLIEMLKAEGPFTLFVPNDAAFAKLPPSLLTTLKKDKVLLKKFLTYAMVNGRLESKDFKEGPLKSIEGEMFTIGTKKGLVLSKGKFVAIDERTANGIIHVVDTVTLPPSLMKFTPKSAPSNPTAPLIPPR